MKKLKNFKITDIKVNNLEYIDKLIFLLNALNHIINISNIYKLYVAEIFICSYKYKYEYQ